MMVQAGMDNGDLLLSETMKLHPQLALTTIKISSVYT